MSQLFSRETFFCSPAFQHSLELKGHVSCRRSASSFQKAFLNFRLFFNISSAFVSLWVKQSDPISPPTRSLSAWWYQTAVKSNYAMGRRLSFCHLYSHSIAKLRAVKLFPFFVINIALKRLFLSLCAQCRIWSAFFKLEFSWRVPPRSLILWCKLTAQIMNTLMKGLWVEFAQPVKRFKSCASQMWFINRRQI